MTGAWYFVGPATSINLSYYSKIKYCWIALSYCHVMLFKYSHVMVFKCLFEGARVFLPRNVVFLPVWVKYVIITAIMSSSKLTCLSSVFWQNPSFLMSCGKSHNWMVSGSQFSQDIKWRRASRDFEEKMAEPGTCILVAGGVFTREADF